MSQTVKSLAKSVLHSSGLLNGFRFLNRRGVRVLMYHRFDANTEVLRKQCEHLRRHYQPVSLKAIGDWIHTGTPLPDNAVTITVDDGYRDFLLHGYPIFREFDLPVTVYVVTDFLDGKLWLWWNQIEYAFEHTPLRSGVSIPVVDVEIKLETGEERHASGRNVAIALTKLKNSERLELLKLIPRLLEVEVPSAPPAALVPLSWNEVRTLAQGGVEFGCHTRTHPILSSITDQGELEEEITGSKKRLEQELGETVSHFCYPNGQLSDFNEQTLALLGQQGFRTAVTTEPGINVGGTEPFLIRRLSVDPALPGDYFERLMSGAFRK